MTPILPAKPYRGRLAPSPTGYLHAGHGRTFWIAGQRAAEAGGALIMRMDDLDRDRVRPEYEVAALEDLRWLGLSWTEGSDIGGDLGPYRQSERLAVYREAFERLRTGGWVYPCVCSRKDIASSLAAPHAGDEEPIYPGTCRRIWERSEPLSLEGRRHVWRFKIPASTRVDFVDLAQGPQSFQAEVDFGDFVVWRHDGLPAYQLACVVDDALMQITEVVRGADLLASTARQILLYQALHWQVPAFYHCPLMTDASGVRLAKRNDALSLRTLRSRGVSPQKLIAEWAQANDSH
ncbi:MAG TPA: tRNA glutamyl-Q(34) synthetase GluQRS [Candidatus Limnocylindria bacterium]|jgi:glutamyl-tRNA synthetase|nr:tRNA glutamyl-Q(34) synthetase GluQRS [Candidatus Limnocylindria bacterium]